MLQLIEDYSTEYGLPIWEVDENADNVDVVAVRRIDKFEASKEKITSKKNYKPAAGERFVPMVIRIDGEKRNSTAAQDGDYVHAFLTMTDGEVNSLTGAEALRRTITLLQQSVFAIYTIVGSAGVAPVATPPASLAIGESVRVPATVLGREFTNALEYRSEDPEVAVAGRGGIVTGVGDGTTDITITNPNTDDSATVEVTVA